MARAMVLLQFRCEVATRPTRGRRSVENDPKRELCSGLATFVLAAAADFHHLGFFGFLAILTTVLAVLLGRTITCSMRTFAGIIVSHRSDLLKVWRRVRGSIQLEGVW